MEISNKKIVFYDGNCGFCNKTVEFLLKNDKNAQLRFAALQSDFADEILRKKFGLSIDFSTFYYLRNDQIFTKSTGFFEVLKEENNSYRWLRIFRFLPRIFTDKCYDYIAKNRNKMATAQCYVPTFEERKRFIA